MLEFATLILFLAAGWFWMDSMRAREAALDAGRSACAAEGVQLLDWTVAMKRMRIARDDEGRVRVRRVYEFEFSDTGNNRIKGNVTLLGVQLLAIHLPVVTPPPPTPPGTSNVVRLH